MAYAVIYDPGFETAWPVLLGHEGGFQNDRNDPGNWTGGSVGAGDLKGTKYGISAAQYPDLDIAELTEDDARAIYYRDWWQKFGFDQLPPVVAAKVFDVAVDIGDKAAVQALQRAIRATGTFLFDDGALGTITIAKAHLAPLDPLMAALRSEIAGHYRLVAEVRPNESGDLAGWLNRAYS